MKRVKTNEKQVQSTSVLKENYLRTYLRITKGGGKSLNKPHWEFGNYTQAEKQIRSGWSEKNTS